MNKASWLLAGIGALAIAGAAVAAAPTPDVKVTRSGESIVLTFPEHTLHHTVGWRVHNQTFHAHRKNHKRAAATWTTDNDVTIDMAKAHRRHPVSADGASQPMEMWIWGQLKNGDQLLQKATVQ